MESQNGAFHRDFVYKNPYVHQQISMAHQTFAPPGYAGYYGYQPHPPPGFSAAFTPYYQQFPSQSFPCYAGIPSPYYLNQPNYHANQFIPPYAINPEPFMPPISSGGATNVQVQTQTSQKSETTERLKVSSSENDLNDSPRSSPLSTIDIQDSQSNAGCGNNSFPTITRKVDENEETTSDIDSNPGIPNPLQDILDGDVIVCCDSCRDTSLTLHPFTVLSLSVVGQTIEECILDYFKDEPLEEKCKKCEKNSLQKKTVVIKPPKTLILHLKRFSQDGCKISTPIKEAITINLQPVFVSTCSHTVYNYLGSINHKSDKNKKIDGGHYTACVKSSERFFSFNDSEVSSLTSRGALKGDSYICFYQRTT